MQRTQPYATEVGAIALVAENLVREVLVFRLLLYQLLQLVLVSPVFVCQSHGVDMVHVIHFLSKTYRNFKLTLRLLYYRLLFQISFVNQLLRYWVYFFSYFLLFIKRIFIVFDGVFEASEKCCHY